MTWTVPINVPENRTLQTRAGEMPYVFFQTFGCQMNIADSDEICGRLVKSGFYPTEDPSLADLIVVNTCSVREHAERRAKVRIGEYGRLKKRDAQLWVIGCMAERLGPGLMAIPGVTRVIGARSLECIDAEIGAAPAETAAQAAVVPHGASGFLSVMRGCDNYCAYCIVPYVRGPEHSIPATDLIDSLRKKADSGIREITLLGQNVNSYRSSGLDFPDLLAGIAEIPGIERIRFTTSHPKDCSEKLIITMKNEPKCCRHFHLPMQAGSDRILKLMNRGYSTAEYLDRIAMIRSHMPEADITTDILVGFPSETEEEFEQTCRLAEKARFTAAFMFAYSVRQGTAAASMPGAVSHSVKQSRLGKLIELQTGITKAVYAGMVGKRVQLMIGNRHTKDDRWWMAMDYGSKRALIACDGLQSGTILDAGVVRSSGMTLVCERTSS